MVKLTADHDRDRIADPRARLAALECPGTVAYTIGPDAGLRDGDWSFAIVADTDADAYWRCDADEEDNRLRAELAPYAEQVARMQFEL